MNDEKPALEGAPVVGTETNRAAPLARRRAVLGLLPSLAAIIAAGVSSPPRRELWEHREAASELPVEETRVGCIAIPKRVSVPVNHEAHLQAARDKRERKAKRRLALAARARA